MTMEVITGGDFKRMVAGAYSEFLLEYEEINELSAAYGTHTLRTMGAAIMPLKDTSDAGIGGLARRVATAAIFGARGNSGVVLAQLFRGIAAGLAGKYEATSSEFGKAFQYGILYAQRVLPSDREVSFIRTAKSVAKGAYHAVRAEKPISEILEAALNAAERSKDENGDDAGAMIVCCFLRGCLRGLDGNFVSPAVTLSLGRVPKPTVDEVKPYCVRLKIKNPKASLPELKRQMHDLSSFSIVERSSGVIEVHLHTNCVGQVIDQVLGWGSLKDVKIINMSESHVLASDALMKVAALAVAADRDEAKRLQEAGASVIVTGSATASPSVGELVGAVHSDLATSYVMYASSPAYHLVFKQVQRLLGNRVELMLCETFDEVIEALKKFSSKSNASVGSIKS